MLRSEEENEIVAAYMARPGASTDESAHRFAVGSRMYLGTYSGYRTVVTVEAVSSNAISVGDYVYYAEGGLIIHCYKDGTFLSLSRAYADGLLSDADLAAFDAVYQKAAAYLAERYGYALLKSAAQK